MENAQEGKTKGMRHWKFQSLEAVDEQIVLSYMKEALDNQKKGMEVKAEKTKEVVIPELLLSEFKKRSYTAPSFQRAIPLQTERV